jgi:hypothetical protein
MTIIPCPACGTERKVSAEELEVIQMCNQFMCWDSCGMDIPIHPLYLFWNARQEGDDEQ